jgi:isopentenyldiphosphate isomerase
MLLHPVVHLHVLNSKGELYLQKRSLSKDIQPGKWDTAVGGHVDYGEEIETALRREAREELGITDYTPVFFLRYTYQSTREREVVNDYYCIYDGDFNVDPVEIDEGRFWTREEIESQISTGIFTPQFSGELEKISALWDKILKNK